MKFLKGTDDLITITGLGRSEVEHLIRGLTALYNGFNDDYARILGEAIGRGIRELDGLSRTTGHTSSYLDQQISEAEAEIEEKARFAREAWARVQELEKKREEVLSAFSAASQAQVTLRRLRNLKENHLKTLSDVGSNGA